MKIKIEKPELIPVAPKITSDVPRSVFVYFHGATEEQLIAINGLSKKKKSVLRRKRLELGLTQQNVADKAKILLQAYQKFESGERNIMTSSFQIACRVIEALEMDVSKFYHGEYVMEEDMS